MKLLLLVCLILFVDLTKGQLSKIVVSGTKPSERDNAGMVYDKKNNRLILFGGSFFSFRIFKTKLFFQEIQKVQN